LQNGYGIGSRSDSLQIYDPESNYTASFADSYFADDFSYEYYETELTEKEIEEIYERLYAQGMPRKPSNFPD
jgi:hypothetical protein